ncbi:MAG: Bro-N domain-containing protein [Patescibacteria group bacterium]
MSNINSKKSIAIFENEPVRRVWLEKEEKWVFSLVDIIRILAKNDRPRKYWNDLKTKLKQEGSQLSEKIGQLKMKSPDGKFYDTDVADVETILRLVQSIPSPKAEPFKLWLAKVGYERLRETVDPEIGVNRARGNWLMLGRSVKWIEQRMRGQEIRNKLTDYWANHEISEEDEFAALTNIIHKEWSGLNVQEHKKLKNLKGHNLRDNMTEAELIFTSLAELSTRHIAEKDLAIGFKKNTVSAKKGGGVAGRARQDFEKLSGQKVISSNNFISPQNKKLIH